MIAAFAVHADLNVMVFQDTNPCFCGKLSALIGVKYLRATVVLDSSFQSLDTKSASSVLDKHQLSTLRACQSMMATR